MTHEEIVGKVRMILNEHGAEGTLSLSEDHVMLDAYIDSAIPDAVTILAQKGYRVNVCNETPGRNATGIVIPDDFISLLTVKFENWKKLVTNITEIGSPEYNMAMNIYTAPKANSPMCYRMGDFLVCLPDGAIEAFEYNAKYVKTDNTETLNAETKEAAAVCYMTAALVMGMFGDDQGKQRLSDISTNMLQ